MIQRLFLTMALFMLFGVPAVFGQQQVPQGADAEADASSTEKQEIVQEIMDAKYRATLLEYRLEKNRKYIENARQNIEDLEYQKAEFEKMAVQLEPYLQQVVSRLEDVIGQDLPFLADERAKRIAGLKNTLEKYELPLSDKMRQVFEEGLQIEANYGKLLEAVEGESLNINGVDTPVVILRLGRLGMYYMAFETEQTGFYNRETGQWEQLPESMNRDIELAVGIGQSKRTVEIVNLPLATSK